MLIDHWIDKEGKVRVGGDKKDAQFCLYNGGLLQDYLLSNNMDPTSREMLAEYLRDRRESEQCIAHDSPTSNIPIASDAKINKQPDLTFQFLISADFPILLYQQRRGFDPR